MPEYMRRDAEAVRNHRWYMSSRLVTMYDIYLFDQNEEVDIAIFTDIIGCHFKVPKEGLGFDSTPASHMWRSIIWPHNFL